VNRPAGGAAVRIRRQLSPPPEWNALLARVPDAEIAAGTAWTELAARHYPGGQQRWFAAEIDGELVGGLAAVARRLRGLVRLESSLDGMLAGPQVPADLPSAVQDGVFAALGEALAATVGGRTAIAAFTVASPAARRRAEALAARGWQLAAYEAAVVDCRDGLAHVERDLWTNNRRNERNRGLKRGCTLAAESTPAVIAEWYPLYLIQASRWAQAPVPLGFLQDLIRGDPQCAVLNTVRLAGRLVGGHFCLHSRDRLVAFQSAVCAELLNTHFLTTLLYWQDIVYACERGLAAVDFGGCVGRDSLWDFKRRCGAEPEARCQLQRRSALGRAVFGAASVVRRWRGVAR